jgi:hypothetical protein
MKPVQTVVEARDAAAATISEELAQLLGDAEANRRSRLVELPSSPTQEFIRCLCGHQANRVAPGVDEWECACPVRRCHAPRQVLDENGTVQLVWRPVRLRLLAPRRMSLWPTQEDAP